MVIKLKSGSSALTDDLLAARPTSRRLAGGDGRAEVN